MLELRYFAWVFQVIEPFRGNQQFDFVTFTLDFGVLFENVYLLYNNWLIDWIVFYPVSAIFQPSNGVQHLNSNFFARSLIMQVNISSDKIFLLALSLLILIYDQHFGGKKRQWSKFLNKKYSSFEFHIVHDHFLWQDLSTDKNICLCDLGHLWNWQLSGAFVFHKLVFSMMLMLHHFQEFQNAIKLCFTDARHWISAK